MWNHDPWPHSYRSSPPNFQFWYCHLVYFQIQILNIINVIHTIPSFEGTVSSQWIEYREYNVSSFVWLSVHLICVMCPSCVSASLRWFCVPAVTSHFNDRILSPRDSWAPFSPLVSRYGPDQSPGMSCWKAVPGFNTARCGRLRNRTDEQALSAAVRCGPSWYLR